MIRKFFGLLVAVMCLALLALPISRSQAADTDTISVTVTIENISVDITETTYAFGVVTAGSTTQSASAVTVTNNGNVTETYSLSLTDPTDWTAAGSPGANIYVLSAAFDADGTITWGASHVLTTTPVACSGTQFAGDQTGLSVAAAAARSLWFQFAAPTSSTVFTEQSITVTVTAAAG